MGVTYLTRSFYKKKKITSCTFYMGEDSSSWTYSDWYSNTRNVGGIDNNGSDAITSINFDYLRLFNWSYFQV